MDSLIEPSQLAGTGPDTIAIENVNLSLGIGRRTRAYPEGYQPARRLGRGDRPDRPVGIGQIDAPDGDGGTGTSRQRRGGGERHAVQCPRRGRAGALPRPPGRHRVPVVSSDPDHDGAGECRRAARTRRQSGCGQARRAGTCSRSGSAIACIITRRNSPAANSSASRWRARWRRIPRSSSPTSRPAISTRPPASRSSISCSPSMTSAA